MPQVAAYGNTSRTCMAMPCTNMSGLAAMALSASPQLFKHDETSCPSRMASALRAHTAEPLWRGGTLTMSNVKAIDTGESMMPMQVLGGDVTIDASSSM